MLHQQPIAGQSAKDAVLATIEALPVEDLLAATRAIALTILDWCGVAGAEDGR